MQTYVKHCLLQYSTTPSLQWRDSLNDDKAALEIIQTTCFGYGSSRLCYQKVFYQLSTSKKYFLQWQR
jgi:hypothetical protein